MTSNVPATTIRIDPEVKREAAAVLDELGLSMSGAMNIFLRAVIREGGPALRRRLGSEGKADGEGGDRDGRGVARLFSGSTKQPIVSNLV